ncbi:MAG: hypothetical protein PHO31_01200, partial [Candidatus Pacebacteria bacterium]|nr:hypothetical protein [Candidatus Paceibacterota bacterium]
MLKAEELRYGGLKAALRGQKVGVAVGDTTYWGVIVEVNHERILINLSSEGTQLLLHRPFPPLLIRERE